MSVYHKIPFVSKLWFQGLKCIPRFLTPESLMLPWIFNILPSWEIGWEFCASLSNENTKLSFHMWNFLEVISYYDKLGTKKSYTQWIKHMNCTWMYNMEVFKRAPWKLAESNLQHPVEVCLNFWSHVWNVSVSFALQTRMKWKENLLVRQTFVQYWDRMGFWS